MTPVVDVQALTVQFGTFKAVDTISFTVSKGEIFGFLGANGAGKTTTIRVLCGLLTPTQGEVKIAGIPLTQTTSMAVKSKVGYMSQKFTLYDDLTVQENLHFTASLRKLEPNFAQHREKELLDFIGFTHSPQTLVKDLSGGMKQQVSLAASILHNPEIVFLDEPTAGVTSAARARFWELIQNLAKQGKTIFVTTHYMDEAEQCERIALMRTGKIIALDSPEGLKKTAFPHPLYELKPLRSVRYEEIEVLKKTSLFQTLEPYGLKYHVTIQDHSAWETFKIHQQTTFSIREIKPSLEDVFIQLVEGKTR